jgi:hypothetical protein
MREQWTRAAPMPWRDWFRTPAAVSEGNPTYALYIWSSHKDVRYCPQANKISTGAEHRVDHVREWHSSRQFNLKYGIDQKICVEYLVLRAECGSDQEIYANVLDTKASRKHTPPEVNFEQCPHGVLLEVVDLPQREDISEGQDDGLPSFPW